ncbi:TetR/AcrR family transcriptional regulator [Sediminivirga luteola]|uniref:TetR family transcriptional regulator n=1 Tax=Sediminivirga luteola TaxID=1774748 RepID=A0A8J2XML6_9MICO|nr:TetR/AcrR family transcriptional regulator [Sediminivirga luteola]MCI2266084.1 TetR/AcrR family transcriptional regulator [Sediminivirga luteola]GGA27623.1 TetR family transcriptional regulator [Sediminivirga luteola]
MPELSTTAERTRRSILMAAVEVLGVNPGAPLAEVAQRAGVSRSTFHRYFADRSALKAAVDELAQQEWVQAVQNARLDDGTGLEAYRRLCGRLMESLPVLVWWMSAAGSGAAEAQESSWDEQNALIAAAIQRGHEDGSIDRALSVEWISSLIWSTLYAVHFIPPESRTGLSPFEAREQAMRTLLKGVAAEPPAV